MEENELQHYGIIGMKWGIRRTPEQLGHAPKSERKMFKKQVKADKKQWRSNRRKTAIAQKEYVKAAKGYSEIKSVAESKMGEVEKAYSKMVMPWNRKKKQEEINRLNKELEGILKRSEIDAGRMKRAEELLDQQIDETLSFVDKCMEKYGSDNVKQMKPKMIADGKSYAREGLKTGINTSNIPFIGQYVSGKQIAEWSREWQAQLMDERTSDVNRKRYT